MTDACRVVEEDASLPGGTNGRIYYRYVPVGGAIVSIGPLSNSVVAVSPVFVKVSRPHKSKTTADADLAFAAVAFVKRAKARAADLRDVSVLDRPRRSVTEPLTGLPVSE